MTEEVQNDAAPSSSEPMGNAAGGASADSQVSDVSVQGATGGENAGEPGNDAGAAADGAQQAGDAPVGGGEAGNGASLAAGSSTAEPASAPRAPSDAGVSQTAANSDAEPPVPDAPQTAFEHRVEARFLALEGYLMKLPHSIAYAFSQGSAEPEELASRTLSHLFSKDQ